MSTCGGRILGNPDLLHVRSDFGRPLLCLAHGRSGIEWNVREKDTQDKPILPSCAVGGLPGSLSLHRSKSNYNNNRLYFRLYHV